MPTTKTTFVGIALLTFAGIGSAVAEVPKEWKACTKEIAKFCPEATDSAAIFACIEKREQMGKHKSGLSHACYEAHERQESPAHEKAEKH